MNEIFTEIPVQLRRDMPAIWEMHTLYEIVME